MTAHHGRTTPDNRAAVVVGIDGSAPAAAALDMAAAEAVARELPLRIVYGHLLLLPGPVGGALATPYLADPQAECRRMLDRAAAQVRRAYPDLVATTRFTQSPAAGALVEESETAALLVVGCRGLGGFTGLLVGSVSAQVAAHAHCPVIVVRPAWTGDTPASEAPVVVGVPAPRPSDAAVEFAFDEAARRGVPLIALHAWSPNPLTEDFAAEEDQAAHVLAEVMSGWADKHPQVPVRHQIRRGDRPVEVLVGASATAGLVVVGSRVRAATQGVLLGAVGHALIHRSACPVAIVHEPR